MRFQDLPKVLAKIVQNQIPFEESYIWMYLTWGFPGSPVVGTSPSNVGGMGSIPGGGNKDSTYLEAKKSKHKTQVIL